MTIYPTQSVFTTKTGNKITFYNLKEKECPRCLKEFLPKHPRTVYCGSDDCNKIKWTQQYKRISPTYNRQNKIPKKNCVICHKEFQPHSLSNKGVCSNMDCRYEQRKICNNIHKGRMGKAAGRKSKIMRNYGLTIEQVEQIEKDQNHCCKICGKHESLNGKDKRGNRKKLSIDHDHTTGQIRGMLCTDCNTALGQFCDNIDVLQKAIVYIEEGKNSKTYIPLKKYTRKKLEEKG
jgi:hypothetical protein